MSKEKRRVPRLRFPGFTGDWEQCKLGEVTNIKTGSRNQQDSVTNGQYPFFIRSEKIEKLDTYDFDTEAILVPGDGRIGEIFHYYNGKFALHQRVYKVDNFKGVDAFFLLYLFQCSFKEHALRLNAQGTVPSLRLPMFTEWNICIPSLQEQICIGRLLNKIELMITLHQRKLNHLILKKKSLLQKLFPKNGDCYPELRFPGFTDAWEQCKLGSLAAVEMNKRIFKEQTTTKGDIPFYKIGTFGSDADSFISRDLFEEYKNKYPYPNIGDILISASGSIGRTVVYNGEDAYYQDSNIVWLNHNGKIDNSFLLQFYNQVKWAGLEGSTIKRLYNKNILETYIAVPKIEEQRLIGEFFKLVDSSITLHQRKLDHLQLQKKALLQQLFV